MERATDFHVNFTYPDGAIVETVDGRVRYHGHVQTMGIAGMAPFDRGRALIRHLVELLHSHSPAGLNTHLADVLRHCPTDTPQAPLPQRQRQYVHLHHDRALVRRSGPWFYCLSGYLTPTGMVASNLRNRWYLDPQNYLSVWHERAGLVIGGGNSKNQPQCGTFVTMGNRIVRHQADEARWLQSPGGDTLCLKYGQTGCHVTVEVLDDHAIRIRFQAWPSADEVVRASLCLPGLAGKALTHSQAQAETILDPLRTCELGWPATSNDSERWIRVGSWRLDLPPESDFVWPEYPFNPYAINNAPPPPEAIGIVSTALGGGGEPKDFLLGVEDGA